MTFKKQGKKISNTPNVLLIFKIVFRISKLRISTEVAVIVFLDDYPL
jgi:hypothetical protein